MVLLDQTASFPIKGYAWLPDLRRRSHGQPVRMRVLGRPAVAVSGPDAARFFYHPDHVKRHAHAPLTLEDGADPPAKMVGEAFDQATDRWRGGPAVSLFGGAAEVITDVVAGWTGVPRDDARARDLVAIDDGFAALGPRRARARAARRRQERGLVELIEDVRRDEPDPSALSRIARHTIDGYLLDARTAAAEVIDLIRPATAVAGLVAFAAHALERRPGLREGLAESDEHVAAFVHEVRRFYPSTPFLTGRATRDLRFGREDIPQGALVLLDVFGQHHDPRVWPKPYEFRPERFLNRPAGEFELIPPGDGDPGTGQLTIALLGTIARCLARLSYYLPPQDLTIDLSRVPARVRSGPIIVVG